MKQSMKKFFARTSVLTVLATAFVGGQALAADTTISGGTLTTTAPTVGDFAAVTLNGQIQDTHATMGNISVSDPTGTGNGWNVNVKASQFSTNGENPLTLPLNSLSIALPSVTAQPGASDISTITTAAGNIDTLTGLKLLSAAQNGGMGSYDVSFPSDSLTLNLLPKDVKAGTYTSTITVTIVTGP